jgi:hypothetical protein
VAEAEGNAVSAKAPTGAQEKHPAAADAAENKRCGEVNAKNGAEAVSRQQQPAAETAAKAEAVAKVETTVKATAGEEARAAAKPVCPIQNAWPNKAPLSARQPSRRPNNNQT